jgi:DNA-binding CsgD family transcriptional regulator
MSDFRAQREPITDLRVVSARYAWNGVGHGVFVPAEWRVLATALGLSPRECGIVRAVFDGASEKDTARDLGLSPHTVHTYLWRVYRKLHVQSREELLVRVFAEFRALPKRTSRGRKP